MSMENETYEVHVRGGREIVIGYDFIRVWYDSRHYQDIMYSEEAVDKIRGGADPTTEFWEDGNGIPVCIENSVEMSD